MATRLKEIDAVIVGMGWTGAIMARELSKAGISTAIATSELAPGALPIAWALAATAGARRIVPAGKRARETAASEVNGRVRTP